MKLTDIPAHTRFWWLYVSVFLGAWVFTIAVVTEFLTPKDFVTAQFLLSYATALGLLSTVEGSAPLTRMLALWVLVISAITNILCHTIFHMDIGVINATQDNTALGFNDFLYFSVLTFTTLGFGDLQPTSETRLAAAFQALSGYMYLGLFIKLVTGGFKPAKNGNGSDHESGSTQ